MIYNQFYSNKNIYTLKNIIYNDLKNKYNIENINVDIQLKKCMFYVKNNVSSKPPNNYSLNDYLNLMNKKVYNLVISSCKNININIDKNSKQKNNLNEINQNSENNENNDMKKESTKIQNTIFDSEILKNYKNNNDLIEYPKPSGIGENNMNISVEKIREDRDLINNKPTEINFNLDKDDNNQNTLELYNELMSTYSKQVSDLNDYENNQKNINDNIENKLNILEEENINKLTPISSLSNKNIENSENIEIDDNINFVNSVNNLQNFLIQNNDEIKKDNLFFNETQEKKQENILNNNNILNNDNFIAFDKTLEMNGNNFSNKNIDKKILLNKTKHKTLLKSDYIVIDSRYRNFELYPNQCNFVIKFSTSDNNFIFNTYSENNIDIIKTKKIVIGNQSDNDINETFDNIHSIRLDNVIVPTHSYDFTTNNNNNESKLSLTIYKDSYLLLEIPELDSPYKGGNNSIKKSFAVLRINHGNNLTSVIHSNNFANLIVPNEINKYEPSTLGKLDKFTIKMNNKNGRLYNFGVDKLYIKNFSKGQLKYLGICGKKDYSTKFEINRFHKDYMKICNEYYNVKDCFQLNNNPLIIRDLIYLYHIIPNENELIFFEDNIKIDSYKVLSNNTKISLTYKLKNKKQNVNIDNLFNSFKIYNDDINDYYFIIIIDQYKYYFKVLNTDENFIYLYNYPNIPNFNKSKVKIGLSKGNKSGFNNNNIYSLFNSSGFSISSIENTLENDDDITSYIIEIDYPYNNLPNFIKENNFNDDDLFLIQDKKQISYGFTIDYFVKDYSDLQSALNESGNN